METKGLREYASDEIEEGKKLKKLKDRAKKAGGKVNKAVKWLTSESFQGREILNEGIGDIVMFNISDEDIEAREVSSMLGVPTNRILGVSSKMNPTLYTKMKKLLTSKHWVESQRSQLMPNVSASGWLRCLNSNKKFPAVAGYWDNGSDVPCVTYFIDMNDVEDFHKIINKTYLT